MQDFVVVESIFFPRLVTEAEVGINTVNLCVLISCGLNSLSVLCVFSEGSNLTPAHHYSDFRFKTYAPIAFRYFRELFGIRPDDYLVSTSTKHSFMFTGTALVMVLVTVSVVIHVVQ